MSSRRGFTLIELLIVVVIIGIIAAIAVPKFNSTKGKAHAAALKGDLHNMSTAQESYFYTWQTYTTDTSALDWRGSTGSQVNVIEATAGGWGAVATHPLSYPLTCALFQGNAAPVPPATIEGRITCQ